MSDLKYFNLDIFKFLHIEDQHKFILCDKLNDSLKIKYLSKKNLIELFNMQKINDNFINKYY